MTGFVAAYSIDAFTDVDKFKADMDSFLQYLADTPPAPGQRPATTASTTQAFQNTKKSRCGEQTASRSIKKWSSGSTASPQSLGLQL